MSLIKNKDVEDQRGRWKPWEQGLKTHFANFSVCHGDFTPLLPQLPDTHQGHN